MSYHAETQKRYYKKKKKELNHKTSERQKEARRLAKIAREMLPEEVLKREGK
jgi:hypothetical protein